MKKDKSFWIKLISIAVVVISWAVFIFMKIKNPELSLGSALIVLALVSVAGVVSFFGKFWYKKKTEKQEENIPEPINEEEREEMLQKVAHEKFWNNILKNKGIIQIDKETIEKNDIYAYEVNMNLDNESFIGIINANFPGQGVTLLNPEEMKSPEHFIKKRMRGASKRTYDEPDVEVTTTENPLTGTKSTTKKKTQKKKEEKKEGDLI